MSDRNRQDFLFLNPLHEKHLEMLKYIKCFCDKYNIEWSLAYGSVLGAKRHGGAIPWDDDADITMTTDQYEKFREMFDKYGDKERFYLQETINIDGMVYVPKLRMNGTTFIEESYADLDMHHGIFIDIFISHKAPKNPLKKLYGSFLCIYLNLKVLADRGYNKRKSVLFLMAMLRLLPKYFGFKYIFNLWYKWDQENSDEFAYWDLRPKFMPAKYLCPIKEMKYEDAILCGPNDIEKYLEFWYGDWFIEPNLKDIQWSQHASVWKVDEDFRLYANNINDFSDEMHRDNP